MRRICKTAVLLVLIGLASYTSRAQDIAESAALTSHSSVVASGAKAPSHTIASPEKQNVSPHLIAHTGPSRDEVNRKGFEDNAGETAGKLLLRSVPSGADVFVNELLVGHTPLLMVIAPGKYEIDMRGPRQESGHSTAGVLPKETETVVINLSQRYPAKISTR
jgi:hypothetical protein